MEMRDFVTRGLMICFVVVVAITGLVIIVAGANEGRAKGVENKRIAEEEYAKGIENGYKVFIDGVETTAPAVVDYSKQLVSVNTEREEINITTKVVNDHTLTAMLAVILVIGLIGGGVAIMYTAMRGY